jgi:hypothetical protein
LPEEDQQGWGWWHVKVQLVYMRERGEYCLVEHQGEACASPVRLTMFRPSYGEDTGSWSTFDLGKKILPETISVHQLQKNDTWLSRS